LSRKTFPFMWQSLVEQNRSRTARREKFQTPRVWGRRVLFSNLGPGGVDPQLLVLTLTNANSR